MNRCFYFFAIGAVLLGLAVTAIAGDDLYRLDTGDRIRVSVWGQDDLLTEATLGPDGRISLPLLGELTARGLTLAELTGMITSGYREYIRVPQVTVALVSRREISVRVIGEVGKPGAYQVRPEATIAEVIAMAGGPAERAALEKVQLFPAGDPEKAQLFPQGKNNLFGQESAGRSPLLVEGDVIFVPETGRIDWQKILAILGGILTLKQIVT